MSDKKTEEPNKAKAIEEPTEKSKEVKKTAKPKSSKSTRHIGFFKNAKGAQWSMFNQMLASKESIERKIKLLYGDVQTHVIEVDLP